MHVWHKYILICWPPKLCRELIFSEAGLSFIALACAGSVLRPFVSIICPKYLILFMKNLHFFVFLLESIVLNSSENLENIFLVFFWVFTLKQNISISNCKVKSSKHCIHYLLKNSWSDLYPESQMIKFIHSSTCLYHKLIWNICHSLQSAYACN